MKIASTKPTKTKMTFLLATAIAILMVAGYGTYAKINNMWPFAEPVGNSPATLHSDVNEDISSDPEAKDSSQPVPAQKAPTDKTPAQYDTPPGNEHAANALTGVINFAEVSEGTLLIRNTIDQRIDNGSCKLTLTHNSSKQTLTRTANILLNPGSSTCQGFDIPASDLSAGLWNIKIDMSSKDKSGVIESTVKI